MQQVLSGKKRLKGFTSRWGMKKLNDIAEIIVSNVDKKVVVGERGVRLCNYMDVYSNDTVDQSFEFMKATATTAQIRRFGLRSGDVLLTKDSETRDDIAVPAYVSAAADDLVCGYHLAIIRPRVGVSGRFLKFYFDYPHTRAYFGSRANGATRYGLTIGAIEDAPVTLPSIEEQAWIAEVLLNAETEVHYLRSAIEGYQAEKQALMQQLLTGKRRVTL